MLSVRIDGSFLPEDDARAFWERFSDWMDAHPGDLGGFAHSEGLVSVHPEMHDGVPTLACSRAASQRPYTTAPQKDKRRDTKR